MKLGMEITLQFILCMFETFSRQDFALVLAGVRRTGSGRQMDRLLDRWRQQQMIVQTGRGREARFRIADKVRRRSEVVDAACEWDRRWDGKWRVFSFDMPENRRRDRVRLWRHLRAARFGFLQRSVWVWPHDVEPLLREIVEAQGMPECFCGFEADRLILCDAREVVATAWDWGQIKQDHTAYLQSKIVSVQTLGMVEHIEKLVQNVRAEYDAYLAAFRFDPFLPRDLWPKGYMGPTVCERHRVNQACLREKLCVLT